MMQDIWLLCGDERIRWAAQTLRQAGFRVHTHRVSKETTEPLPETLPLVLLPFPSLAGDCLRGEAPLPLAELLPRLTRNSTVLGSKLGVWKAAMSDRGAAVYDLYDSEPLTTHNAAVTAEGALALAMENSPAALYGASCLVIGFGRIGKLLTQRLAALGAEITVAARSPSDRALAAAWGHQTLEAENCAPALKACDFVFNTVPAPVLNTTDIRLLSAQAVLLELASPPGGFSREAALTLGKHAVDGSGLPGRCSPKTAGELYARCVISVLKKEGYL